MAKDRRVQVAVRLGGAMVLILGVEVDAVTLAETVQILVIAVAAFVVTRMIHRLFARYEDQASGRSTKTLSWGLQSIVVVVALLGIGATASVDVSSVVIGLGAGSIAISFALSTIINNLVSGFLVQADGTVRVGDTISVGGIEGRVVRMKPRAMMLVTKEGALVYVPNAFFMSNPVINRGRGTGPGPKAD